MDKTIARRISYFILIALFFVLIYLNCFSFTFADEGALQGSDVLTDLSGDSSFNAQYYPIDNEDYSLSIITVAESANDELLIYVYQPAVNYDFRANFISISTTVNDDIQFVIKGLTFCNKSGSLYKYVVDDFKVSHYDEIRYYEIASIFRPFNSSIDTQASFDNSVNAVSFEVSKCWKIGEINGNSYVQCYNIDTVVISNKYVGFCRYRGGAGFFSRGETIDAHFVAFSTNYDIEQLYEADVWFKTQSFTVRAASLFGPIVRDENFGTYGPEVEHFKTCYSTEHVQRENGAWCADDYDFYRIMSTSDFISTEMAQTQNVYGKYDGKFINLNTTQTNELTTAALDALSETQWVLRFYESTYYSYWTTHPGMDEVYQEDSTSVTSVTILRLKFKSNGVVYNLGCIDNMQTGGSVAANRITQETQIELAESVKDFLKLILIVLAVIAILFLLYFLAPVFKVFFAILSFPFKVIAKLIQNRKVRKEKRADKERNERIDGLIEAADKKNNYRYRRR